MAQIKKYKNYYSIIAIERATADHTITHTKRWYPPAGMTPQEAEQEAIKQASEFEAEINGSGSKITFGAFSQDWISTLARPRLRKRTIFDYERLIPKINKYLGAYPLSLITPVILLQTQNSLRSDMAAGTKCVANIDLKAEIKKSSTIEGFCKSNKICESSLRNAMAGKPLSVKTAGSIAAGLGQPLSSVFSFSCDDPSDDYVYRCMRLIGDILEDAVLWQYIPANPIKRIALKKPWREEATFLDEQQAIELLDLLKQEPVMYRTAVLLIIYTGMRRGEALGLEWQDVNWQRKTIFIRRTSLYIPGEGVITDKTKNRSSTRCIYVGQSVLDILEDLRSYLIQNGSNPLSTQRIILNGKGKPMRPDDLGHWFVAFRRRNQFPDIHLHSLRHTYATLMIANGVAVTTVAKMLGHSTSETTSRLYAHALDRCQLQAAGTIDSILGKTKYNS